MEKLECLKELKTKLTEINEINSQIKESLFITKTTEQCLQRFAKEKQDLLEERLNVVETLKSINGDLNCLDTVIKETREQSVKHFETFRDLNNKIKQAKSDFDKLKNHIGLPILNDDNLVDPEISEVEKLPNLMQGNCNLASGSLENLLNKTGSSPKTSNVLSNSMAPGSANASTMSSGLTFGQHHSSVNAQNLVDSISSNLHPDKKIERSVSSFYQQPPPMKTCLSCQQQIHRNAPICPYCKAKSRSRHPRKLKKKSDN